MDTILAIIFVLILSLTAGGVEHARQIFFHIFDIIILLLVDFSPRLEAYFIKRGFIDRNRTLYFHKNLSNLHTPIDKELAHWV